LTAVSAEQPAGIVRVAVLAFAGVDDLDLLGAHSVLAKAAQLSDPAAAGRALEVRLVADRAGLQTAAGIRLDPQAGLDYAANAHALVLPGGRGIVRQLSDDSYLQCLRAGQRNGVRLYCVCSGVLLAAAAGVVSQRTLAIHAAKQAELTALTDCRCTTGLVRDGLVTTVGGDQACSVKSVDLALQLLHDLAGWLIEPLAARTELVQGRTLRVVEPVGR